MLASCHKAQMSHFWHLKSLKSSWTHVSAGGAVVGHCTWSAAVKVLEKRVPTCSTVAWGGGKSTQKSMRLGYFTENKCWTGLSEPHLNTLQRGGESASLQACLCPTSFLTIHQLSSESCSKLWMLYFSKPKAKPDVWAEDKKWQNQQKHKTRSIRTPFQT